MQSYLTIDKGKAETGLLKMGLCLWIYRDSKIESVILLDVPIIVKSLVCTLERLWSLILLWHGWEIGDVRPRTNSCNAQRLRCGVCDM